MNLEEKKLVQILEDYRKGLESLDESKLERFNLEGAIMEIQEIIVDQMDEEDMEEYFNIKLK